VHTENYRQFRQFRFFGVAIVSFLFIAVTLNYFYINYLNTEIANLEVDLTLTNDTVSLLEKLKQEKNRKELLVSNSGVQQKEFLSYFLDKIGETVPKAISLQDLEVFPVLETLKEKRKVVLQQQIIEIDGTSPESETLDDWMERMNRFDWVKSVELISYLKSENSIASFKLLITLNL
jgi:Tfp pilus assembly protein PilN